MYILSVDGGNSVVRLCMFCIRYTESSSEIVHAIYHWYKVLQQLCASVVHRQYEDQYEICVYYVWSMPRSITKFFVSRSNSIPTRKHLICKRKLNYLTSLAKWLSVRLLTKWLWVRIQLLPLKFRYSACFKKGIPWHLGN